MDKYEYKHLVEQIQSLIEQREYAEAVAIADRIDWRRVRSVMMLGTISDLYKINHRFEDARDIMLLAYDRKPENRQICYSLCELYIKTGEMVEAVEFYKEFVQLAPRDPGRYVLQYKLYEANEVSLEERCEVLEELKKHDYQEKWMYELATLYHRMGLATQCVEVCDELILWFGSGKYVNKAMELKMLHEQLTPDQQARYDRRHEPEMIVGTDITGEIPVIANSGETSEQEQEESTSQAPEVVDDMTRVFEPEEVRRQLRQQAGEPDIQVRNVDVSAYGTMNLQAEIAAGLREVLAAEDTAEGSEYSGDDATRIIHAPAQDEEVEAFDPSMTGEMPGDYPQEPEVVEQSEVYFGETGEMVTRQDQAQEAAYDYAGEAQEAAYDYAGEATDDYAGEALDQQPQEAPSAPEEISGYVMAQMRRESMNQLEQEAMTAQPPEPMAQVMTQEADGQIKLVLPENPNPEKQITGQLSIEDIRAEWERMKKESQEKQEEEVRQQVIRQTGRMFTEFEEAMRDDILRQMEEGRNADMLSIKPSKSTEQAEATEAPEPEQAEATEAPKPEQEEATEAPEPEQAEATEAPEPEQTEAIPAPTPEAESAEQESAEYESAGQESADQEADYAGEDMVFDGIDEEDSSENGYEAQAEESDGTEEAGEEDYESIEDAPIYEEVHSDWGEGISEYVETDGEWEPVEEPEAEESEAEEPEAEEPEAEEPEAEEPEAEEPEAEEPETEEPAETPKKDAAEADPGQISREPEQARAMTREEKELFSALIQGRAARAQLVKALDNISLAAYTGNVIISGEAGTDTFGLAKNIIRAVQMGDSNFAGKVAKISGNAMNGRDVAETIQSLQNGGLIITGAAQLNDDTLREIYKALQHDNFGIVLIIIDTKKNLKNMMRGNEEFRSLFTAYVDLRPMSIEALAAFARQYAREQEFCIGDLGMLALHTKIDEMQSVEHSVTLRDVKYIMDDAIASASRKSIGHFIDILFGRRYDDEDMIIITEKDFQ